MNWQSERAGRYTAEANGHRYTVQRGLGRHDGWMVTADGQWVGRRHLLAHAKALAERHAAKVRS